MHRVLCLALTAGLLLAGPPAQAEPAADPVGSTYTPVSPVRVLDTRDGGGNPAGPGGGPTLGLDARLPDTATAVVLNVTAVTPTADTYVTVFPTGTTRPTASNLNLGPGDTRANQVTVALGTQQSIDFYNNAGNIHLVADLAGFYSTDAGAKFTALPPDRALDTRQTGAPVGPGATRVLDLADRIPTSATSVTFNLTATDPTAATYVTAFPPSTGLPHASNINLPAGDTRANLVTVAVDADRTVRLYNNAGTIHLIADLTGFYTPDYGASFVPMSPARVLDTRNGTGTGSATDPLAPGEILSLDLANGLPLTSTGVVLNITGVDATASTYVTAWSQFELLPNSSTLNLSPGQTVPNAATVAFTRVRAIQLYNFAGNTHLVADLAGVFAVLDPPCTTDCVYSWGDNFYKKLGTGQAVVGSPTPTRVAALSEVLAISGGGSLNGYALRADGTVWAWGSNQDGQLGNGWQSDVSGGGSAVPVPVVGLSGVTAIAGGEYFASALRSDGTVWTWGRNNQAQLGNGTLTNSSVPVQVSGLTNVTAITTRLWTGYALRADGTVWAWGDNTQGALGNGSTAAYSTTPVQVTGLTGVTAVSAGDDGAYALRTDGTVWAWGSNGEGELGNGQPCVPGTACESRVPVQVSGLAGVTAVAGNYDGGYAVHADGTVWAWGTARNGRLGDGTVCSPFEEPCESRVPVAVSDLADVTQVAGHHYGAYALLADGTVRAWGSNERGALGNPSVPDPGGALVPVPVVGVSGVSAVAGSTSAGYAIVP